MKCVKNILLIDKPVGWTSFDVVAKVRSTLRTLQASNSKSQITKTTLNSNGQQPKSKVKVGHAGTLDPFATGLLIVLLGDECKNADQFLKLDKSYEFTATLGEVSSTGDPEGILKQVGDRRPKIEEVKAALEKFTGVITQTPPAFSAIKINGKRAYKLAREGKEVEVPSRQVKIHSLELIDYDYPHLKARCSVSSGTYIRSLVQDIGEQLGVGAYCRELRRTKIGEHSVSEARSIEEIVSAIKA